MQLILLGVTAALAASAGIEGDAFVPYRGQPVLSVDIEAPGEVDVAELRSLIDIQPGYLLATADVEAAIKRLYALGRFADVGLTAERLSGTVSLHFYVRPIRRLLSLSIEGTDLADADALRQSLNLQPGAEVDSRTEPRLVELAVAHLQRVGFPEATVTVELTPEPESTDVVARLQVREGRPLRVGEIWFTGRPRLGRELLLGLIRARPGGILDREQLRRDADSLLAAYRSHGFLAARIDAPEIVQHAGVARVSFPIQAGDRFVIAIEGNRVLTRDDLWLLWPTANAALQSTDLEVFQSRIRDAYRRLGHQDVRVELRSRRDEAAEVTEYRIRVEEGPAFQLTDITFVGARAIQPHLLAAQVRSYLARSLGSTAFFERLRAPDRCLAWPRTLADVADAAAGCPRPVPDPDARWVPALVDGALEEIAAAYHELGFLGVRLGPNELVVDGHRVSLRVPVYEGDQTRIEAISFRGNEAFDAAALLAEVETASGGESGGVPQRPGAPYSANGIEDARIGLLRTYRDLGYLYANAFAEVAFSSDRRQADVSFRVEEGPQVRIQRILLRGNRYTRDWVLRSRLTLAPGDIYRLEQAMADQRALAALGVFSSVRVKLIDEEKPAELKDLVAEVIERPRQPVEVTVGASSEDGPRAGISYSHINILGTASTFTGSLSLNRKVFFGLYGKNSESMSARYREFSFLEQLEREVRLGLQSQRFLAIPFDPSARIDLVHERRNEIPFSLDSVKAIFGVDAVPFSSLTLALEPQVELTNLQCVGGEAGTGEDLCSEEAQRRRRRLISKGLRRAFKFVPSLTWDGRDNPFNPTRGLIASVKTTYALGRSQPEAGSSVEERFSFAKIEGSLSGYVPVHGIVVAGSARVGTIHLLEGKTPIDERFFLGGRSTLRGFAEGGQLIAEDVCVVRTDLGEVAPPNCEVIESTPDSTLLTTGGEFFLLFKLEARVPVPGSDDLSFGAFVDWGNLWVRPPAVADLTFRVGTGLGLRYATPVGPLALDVGINIDPRRRNRERATPLPHFSVGVF